MNKSEIPSCEHAVSEIRAQTISGGSIRYIRQCLKCGHTVGQAIGKDRVPKPPPSFDDALKFLWDAQMEDAYNEYRRTQSDEQRKKSSEWWKRYNDYLKSDHWQRVRRHVLIRDEICQKCFRYHSDQAHHLSYESYNRYGYSFAIECVGVCSQCHLEIHNDYPPEVPIP